MLAVAALVGLVVAVVARPGYDTAYALAWGRDLVAGASMDVHQPSSPTPHPLTLAASYLAALTGPNTQLTCARLTSGLAAAATIAIVAAVSRQVAARSGALGATAALLASAPVALLAIDSSADLSYVALACAGVWLTLRSRTVTATALLALAATLRPEAILLAAVPSFWAPTRADRRRAIITWVVGAAAAGGAWLAVGYLAGDPLIGLHSAAGNAALNDNPRGLPTALSHLLPDLASATGPLITATAVWASTAAIVRHRRHRAATTDRQVHIITAYLAAAVLLYLAQGLLGTPLVARYLLFAALLCVPLALNQTVTLSDRLAHDAHRRRITITVLVATVVGSTLVASIPGWRDLLRARSDRTIALQHADDLLHSPLARTCPTPLVVRSPALVPVAALDLNRTLSTITVGDSAGTGVLLEPLTIRAATLDGYGPTAALDVQAQLPDDAPPRQQNADWALYSRCYP